MDQLNKEALERLYLHEKKTESEIAKLYGVSQGTVSRRRKKWGIRTMLKSERVGLPETFTDRQQMLLIGSMLGDGMLFRTGNYTAAYSEFHSEDQKDYLDWKVSEWGEFVVRVSSITHPRGFKGFTLTTHASRLFRPYYDLFYPDGKGPKTFRLLDPGCLTPLALAVWFMDDGSRSSSYARFSVGPDPKSQAKQLKALRVMGLSASLCGDKDDHSIEIKGPSYTRFVDLIAPHIHPSMGSKLDVIKPRRAGIPPREKLTKDLLVNFLDRGLTLDEIAKITSTSRTSVSRHIRGHGLQAPKSGPRARKGYTIKEAHALLRKEKGLEESLKVLLRTPVPILSLSESDMLHDWEVLKAAPTVIREGELRHPSIGGSRLCKEIFSYIWDAQYKENVSARAGWYDPKTLEKAIRFQLRMGDPVTPVRVFRAVCATLRAPTNFRPCYAKAIVDKYCPPGGVVLDPCAGYGGRAAGTLASGKVYVGVDPHPKAPHAYERLSKTLGLPLKFHASPFEDVDLGILKADLVFTSPPYFSVERYSTDPTQSWVRYRTWASWVSGFLEPLISKSLEHLKPEGLVCINTKNVKMGGKEYPIVNSLIELATEKGLEIKETVQMPLGRLNHLASKESIFVFRRTVK